LHYNNKLGGYGEWLVRSLETKWGLIKHNAFKFCHNYRVVLALNESDVYSEDVILKTLKLYKSKHPKNASSYSLLVVPQKFISMCKTKKKNVEKLHP
jgi:hypothetical protein